MMKYNKLYLEDEGIGNVIIKLNDFDITKGIKEYNIERTAENDKTVTIDLKMEVIPELIKIEKKNSKSSKD